MGDRIYGKDTIRSRVFVSCGQKNKQEKMIASELETRLTELEYDPYVAIHKQSTGSLIRNILDILRKCEYYLFIDFEREQLMPSPGDPNSEQNNSKEVVHRGSLFSNQELSIAIYLEKPLIAFQENHVKNRDGMLSAVHANVVSFDDRKGLVDRVIKKVINDWTTNWRNEAVFQDKEGKAIAPEYINHYGSSGWPAIFIPLVGERILLLQVNLQDLILFH